jgi:drug/metabolite transporter (DMT)-like permease
MNIKNIYLQLCLSAFFWGGSAIAGKLLLEEITPATVTFLRFFVSVIILFFFLKIKKEKVVLTFKEHIKYLMLGLTGVSACYYFYFLGLYYSSAFNAALIESTIPLLTLSLAISLKDEKWSLNRCIGFILAYLGVFCIVTKLNINSLINFEYNTGDILLLISTLCFAVYNIMVKKCDFKKNSATVQMYYIFLYGSLGLLPWFCYDIIKNNCIIALSNISFLNIFNIIFISLGSSVLAYIFFNKGIKEIGVSKASGFINLVPFITIVLSIILLGEHPTYFQYIGASLVLVGVYISQTDKIRSKIYRIFNIKCNIT